MESPPTEPAKHGCAALLVGTFAYLVLAVEILNDEPIALPFQLIMGFVASLFLMFFARLMGLLLRVEPFSDIWYWSRLIPATVVAIGMTGVFYHNQIHPWLVAFSWFTAIFGTTHFWFKKEEPKREGEQPPSDNKSP